MTKNLGSLFIVSTPIGNLNDITFRAIEVLNKVHICASEDTRTSGVLFKKYNINTKLISYHKFSEKSKINKIIDLLKSGKDIALISDAGTPLISDPGHFLVEAAIQNQIRIIPIPGATSIITALSISGFKLNNFSFYGFFPRKSKERKVLLKKIAASSGPSVLFESGRRLEKLFDFLSEELKPDCRVLVARELTKLHETLYRSELYKMKEILLDSEFGLKGEFVIIIDGHEEESEDILIEEEKRILGILMEKLDKKLALQIASEILKKRRNEIYKIKMKT
ncbi:MAG: 16S rRNA (cytidine(1402)-2'-O)-methyltransferase [Pseudomonadota bacterium]|nr:16S rRNA (cytidine(1402)-2'-O)-methyltransferase [Pseudomonadota bacterium]